jgi:hypothetical protein
LARLLHQTANWWTKRRRNYFPVRVLASGRALEFTFVLAGSSNVLAACSDASAGLFASVVEVSFAACAGAPVATVSGTPGSPPIVPGSFRPQPLNMIAAPAMMEAKAILIEQRTAPRAPSHSRAHLNSRSSFLWRNHSHLPFAIREFFSSAGRFL